ncbi:glycosyltransferase family 4 protein [Flavobacterium sp.]|uniref:glycosyltransferase family 4 protein n=1 Tax=Flavobacterium sp. TaxID=239 RepID=UPI0025C699A5|nr:glycosyltransferase family 4 protein [Flavobacterium sp.]
MREGNLLLIWDRIGDYHLARVHACEKVVQASVYTADLAGTDALYKWESIDSSKHTILSDKSAEESDILNRFKAFRKLMKEKNIKFVAMPYGRMEYHLFLLYARLSGVRTIVFCESWYSRGGIKDFLKSLLLKTIGQYFFVSGHRAFTHLTERYKIHPTKVAQGYSVVDNSHFEKGNSSYTDERKNIVCVARYSKEKNLIQLINAFAKSKARKGYKLLLVGDGPDRKMLQQHIVSLGLEGEINLSGWVAYTELPGIYETAACLVLPSLFEPWGLVVNEAMAAGLPIILSEECGCLPDLLHTDKNGWSFKSDRELELVIALDQFADKDIVQRKEMSLYSINTIRAFTPQTWAGKIVAMIGKA